MAEMLVDTSALIAFFVKSEERHGAARQYVLAHPRTRWVILESVFDEAVTWFRVKVSIADSIAIGHVLRTEHRYCHLSDDDDEATWAAFCRYDDKAWSYTDCSILVMARRLGISHVFAFDEHINQMAGHYFRTWRMTDRIGSLWLEPVHRGDPGLPLGAVGGCAAQRADGRVGGDGAGVAGRWSVLLSADGVDVCRCGIGAGRRWTPI